MICRLLVTAALLGQSGAPYPSFRAQEIDRHVGTICYAVATADVNNDGRRDVVAVTEDAVVWYENPSWARRDIVRGQTARDNVCIAPHDIDRDGRIDFALGAGWRPSDTNHPGTLQWLGRDRQGRWQVHPIRCDEPTIHRIRFGAVRGDGTTQLVVAPLQGRGAKGPDWGEGPGARLLMYDIPADPTRPDWPFEVAEDSLHTLHSIQLVDFDGDQRDEILAASWEGVTLIDREPLGHWEALRVGAGDLELAPNRGSSEVKLGTLADGRYYIATIEPWHGSRLVVYTPHGGGVYPVRVMVRLSWDRHVLAEPLQQGHALWCADLDGDGDNDLIVGQRDPNPPGTPGPRGPGVFVFEPKPGPREVNFERHNLDDGGIACEDLVAADLNGDGRVDIVAGGRASHNVKIYWNCGPGR